MATTKPTDNILFAESAAVGRATDPSGVRSGGYPLNAAFPSSEANYLFRAAGRYAKFAADGFGANNGQLSLTATNGYVDVATDNGSEIAFRAAHSGAGLGIFQAQVFGFAGGDRLVSLANGSITHTSTVNNRRLQSGGFGPLYTKPASGATDKRTETLYLSNMIKAVGVVRVNGTSGSYSAAILNPGSGNLEYNIASLAFAADGTITLTLTDALPASGSFSQLFATVFADAGGDNYTVVAEQVTPLSTTAVKFRLRAQASTGGTWYTVTPSTASVSNLDVWVNIQIV